jgi:tetratricopeptide (TPR) repeat protein
MRTAVRKLRLPLLALLLAAMAAACSKDPEVVKREAVKAGDQLAAQGKLPEAIIEYRKALQQDARYGEARTKLADAYVRSGDLQNAYRETIRAADVLANDADAQVKAGQMLLRARQFSDAASRADKALAIKPRLVEAQILRANALAGLNRFDDAVAEVEDAIQSDPGRASSYTSLGILELTRGQRKDAEAAFRKAVDAAPQSPDARMALANYYWAVGQQKDAEDQLKTVLGVEPTNLVANRFMALLMIGQNKLPDAEPFLKVVAASDKTTKGKLGLADYYVASKRFEDAQRVLNEVASAPDGFAKATLRLAGIGALVGRIDTSVTLIDSVLAKEPKNLDALVAKATVLGGQRKLDDALRIANSAVEAGSQSALARFTRGQIHALRNENPEAIADFTDALKLDPKMTRAEIDVATLYLRVGRLDDAAHFAESALTKVAGAVDAHLILARVAMLRGDLAAAERPIRAMAKALPKNAAIQTELGELEMREKNYAAARAAFQRAVDARPNMTDPITGLLVLDIMEGHGTTARARVESALKAAPNDAALQLVAGKTYAALDERALAEKSWKKATELNPDNLEAYVLLARLYVSEKRVDEAVAGLTKLTETDPKSVQGRTILGMLLQAQRKWPEATKQYEATLALDPNAAVAANNLAMIYLQSGENLDAALQYAKTARSRIQDRPEVSDTLGLAYYKRGLATQAVSPFSEAVQLAPKNPEYQYHLGMAQFAAGDRVKARATLTQALALAQTFDGADDARKMLSQLQ